MGNKIINIAVTVFMLTMCLGLMVTFQFVNALRDQNYALERVNRSVLSTDGSLDSADGISMTDAEIEMSIKHMKAIDKQRSILKKEIIYGDYTINNTKVREIESLESLNLSSTDKDGRIIKYSDFNNETEKDKGYIVVDTNNE